MQSLSHYPLHAMFAVLGVDLNFSEHLQQFWLAPLLLHKTACVERFHAQVKQPFHTVATCIRHTAA